MSAIFNVFCNFRLHQPARTAEMILPHTQGRRLPSQWATISRWCFQHLWVWNHWLFSRRPSGQFPQNIFFNKVLEHFKPCLCRQNGCFKPNRDLFPKLWNKRANVWWLAGWALLHKCRYQNNSDHSNVFKIKRYLYFYKLCRCIHSCINRRHPKV